MYLDKNQLRLMAKRKSVDDATNELAHGTY
jgi:hypothetical protein